MIELLRQICPLNRSLVSDGYDEALRILDDRVGLNIHAYPSGTQCWTWRIPQKWTVHEAYIEAEGQRIVDVADHPLHLWSSSLPVDRVVTAKELEAHLAYDPDRPDSIPFRFNFYDLTWGFSVTWEQYQQMDADEYHVVIDAEHTDGELKVGEATIEGHSDEMVIFMAHLDHPAQANDGLSGVVVGAELVDRLRERDLHYTYQFLFLPETIGSIAYFSHNEDLIPRSRCGVFLEMLGNDNVFALQHSLQHDDFIDRAARRVLVDRFGEGNFMEGRFREVVGNDEMVLNGPGLGVPTISISRWPYPEYHTDRDTPQIISEARLEEACDVILDLIDILETDFVPRRRFKGPIFLSGHGLWVDYRENFALNRAIEKVMLSLEGDQSILDIADQTRVTYRDIHDFVQRIVDLDLAEIVGRGADLERQVSARHPRSSIPQERP